MANHHNSEWLRIKVKETAETMKTNKALEQIHEGDITVPTGVDYRNYYRLRVAEIMLYLKNKILFNFGMFVILGWQEKWRKEYASLPDQDQNIFKEHRFSIFRYPTIEVANEFLKTIQFDGAILINERGTVTDSGVFIEGLRPIWVAKELKLAEAEDLSSCFGFRIKVHTRHLSAISASYQLKDTTIYIISKKTDDFRIFENGRIVYSTVKGEEYIMPKNAKIFLVDDNNNLREKLKYFLSQNGHQIVLEANSLENALKKAKEVMEKSVDIAIVDGCLALDGNSGEDGKQVAKALREESPTIKIIGFSSHKTDFGDVNLRKCSSLEELEKAIRNL
jgi:CheY-like chemotaxis protein